MSYKLASCTTEFLDNTATYNIPLVSKRTSSNVLKHIHHIIYTRRFVGYNSFQLSKSYMRITPTFSFINPHAY